MGWRTRSACITTGGETPCPPATSLLDAHTALQYRSLDRILLHAYIPLIQSGGGLVRFLERDGPYLSPALLQRCSDAFVRELKAYAAAQGAPWVLFAKGEKKETRMRPLFLTAEREGRLGLVAVGVSQSASPAGARANS